MAKFFDFNRKEKKTRQEWNPHWLLKLLYGIWMTCFSALKIAVGAVATVLLIVIVCGLVFVGILGNYLQDDILPIATFELDDYKQEQTSFVYYVDSDGKIQQLQRIYATVNRQMAEYEELPDALIHAAIAIEDKRFYEHQGVDWITTVKACVNMFFGDSNQFGGSTITQQMIKNRTRENSVTVQRKVAEIFKATYCEKHNDKNIIMTEYLNTIYLGEGCWGVKSAAAVYFGKELEQLTIAECASLISITNNPSLYDPYISMERNRSRQLDVLAEMRNQGWITEEEYNEAVAQEIVLKRGISDEDRLADCPNPECGYSGTVGTYALENEKYYCPQCGTETPVSVDASQAVYSWYVETVIEDVAKALAEKQGVDWNSLTTEEKEGFMAMIRSGGYHIYTCLDMDVQNQVDAVYTNLSEIPTARSNQQLQSGIVVIDNRTGDIVAIAGGVGEKTDFDAFNRAVDAKLQTGSSQKPLTVYAPAFESGAISPATVIKDMPITYNGGAFPKNDNRKYQYSRTVFSGIVSSVNAVAVHTLDRIGFEYSYNFGVENFGLTTLVRSYILNSGKELSDLGYSPLALGALTVGCSVRDMSNAYATFANNGVWREGRTFTKVYDSEGNLVIDNTQESRQILSEKTINYMNYCLSFAVSSGTGGSASLWDIGINVAGKTGTTASNKDRWFCGYTGYYTAAVWCGYDIPEVINLTGWDQGNPAARLWRKVMRPLHVGKENISLYSMANFVGYSVCLDSMGYSNEACRLDVRELSGLSRVASAYAYRGDGPGTACTRHVTVNYCVTGGGVASEYCSEFDNVKIQKRSLLRMNQAQVDEIVRGCAVGLDTRFMQDNYVYFVDNSGNDASWHGFRGNANKNVNAPYLVCPVHTKEAWEKMQEEKAQEEAEKNEAEATAADPAAMN